jgi:lantibiotic transport system permease protein
MIKYLHCLQAEWLKTRRSLSAWLVVIGGLFVPVILIVAAFVRYESTRVSLAQHNYWIHLWQNAWESISLFLLPMGIILAASLITQIEYKNNTWKQLHTTPQQYHTIFIAKLSVLVMLYLQFFVLFNIGLYMAGILPSIFIPGAPWPSGFVPVSDFWNYNINFFICALPIVSLQFLLSMHFKNFLVPVGVGLAIWIASLSATAWKYNYLLPYNQAGLAYLIQIGKLKKSIPLQAMSLIYTSGSIVIAYILYITKKEKG